MQTQGNAMNDEDAAELENTCQREEIEEQGKVNLVV